MKQTLSELKYTFYIFSHPFDGFWLMKKEKKGTWRAGAALLVLLIAAFSYRSLCSGWLFSSVSTKNFSLWTLGLIILVAVLLYCIANWSLTTLMDGKGSIEEIFVSLMYSLAPIIILNIPITLLSQILVLNEEAFFTFFNAISIIWSVFLLIISNLTIHEYTTLKSICTIILTVFAMAAIAVVVLLIVNLTQQAFRWVTMLINELSFRF